MLHHLRHVQVHHLERIGRAAASAAAPATVVWNTKHFFFASTREDVNKTPNMS
jgi:hypothetical protein